ncbi:MAG: hypothetical protein H0V07_01575, partial [Propionibacteriales bacterium]|nr:hypothetical protein [Propionibacteriales bacterium]
MSTVHETPHSTDETVAFRGRRAKATKNKLDLVGFDPGAPLLQVEDLQVEFRT